MYEIVVIHFNDIITFLEMKDLLSTPISTKVKTSVAFSMSKHFSFLTLVHRAPVAQLVEYRAAMREVVSSTPAGPTLRVFK